MNLKKLSNRFLPAILTVFIVLCVALGSSISVKAEEVLTANSYDSLLSAIEKANNGDTILVTNNIVVENELKLSKSITIDFSNKNLTRSSNYSGTLLNIYPSGKVTIKNIVIDGGAKWSLNNTVFDNYIKNNTRFDSSKDSHPVTFHYGIVSSNNLISNSGTLKFENSKISNFYSDKYHVIASFGMSNTEIINTSITDCAGLEGGTIIFATGTAPKVTIEGTATNNSLIKNNYSGKENGLFYFRGGKTAPAEIVSKNVEYLNNYSVNTTGSIFDFLNSIATLENNKINNNKNVKGNIFINSTAIYLSGDMSKLTIDGIEMNNNMDAISTNEMSSEIIIKEGVINNDIEVNGLKNKETNNSTFFIDTAVTINGNIKLNNHLRLFDNNGVINGNIEVNALNNVTNNTILINNKGLINGNVDFYIPSDIEATNIIGNFISGKEKVTGTVSYYLIEKINPGEYLITFNYNGGEDSKGFKGYTLSTKENWKSHAVVENTNYVKNNGYTFEGWYTDASLTEKWDHNNIINQNIIVSAKWKPILYDFTYVIDGEKTTQKVAYNSTIPVPKTPTKQNYVFDYWSPEIPSTMPAYNLTVNAVWKIPTYELTYIIDDERQISFELKVGAKTEKISDPQKEGYVFAGWSREIPSTMPDDDVIIVAKWEKQKYTLTLVVDGKQTTQTLNYGDVIDVSDFEKEGYKLIGWSPALPETMPANNLKSEAIFEKIKYTFTYSFEDKNISFQVYYGEKIPSIKDPEKDGYTFIEWSELPDTMPAINTVVTPIWKPNVYQLIYSVDGIINSKDVNYNDRMPRINPPSKEGYTFVGWNPELPNKMPLGGFETEAVFKINTYTLTYIIDGKETKISLKYGEYIPKIAIPEKDGYEFKEWSVSIPEKMPAGNFTTEAIFKKIDDSKENLLYSLTFDSNGGTSIQKIFEFEGAKIDLTEDKYIPSRLGYSFEGWYSSLEFKTKLETLTIVQPITIYAKWKVISPYRDISPQDWFFESAHNLYVTGLMTGYDDRTFRPDNETNRAMIVQILWNISGNPVVDMKSPFKDVGEDAWYAQAIKWAASENIVNGYGDGLFGPTDQITREQLATILWRYTQYNGLDTKLKENVDLTKYSDENNIQKYAVDAIKWAIDRKLIVGITEKTLSPNGLALRSQTATIIDRYYKNVNIENS